MLYLAWHQTLAWLVALPREGNSNESHNYDHNNESVYYIPYQEGVEYSLQVTIWYFSPTLLYFVGCMPEVKHPIGSCTQIVYFT